MQLVTTPVKCYDGSERKHREVDMWNVRSVRAEGKTKELSHRMVRPFSRTPSVIHSKLISVYISMIRIYVPTFDTHDSEVKEFHR